MALSRRPAAGKPPGSPSVGPARRAGRWASIALLVAVAGAAVGLQRAFTAKLAQHLRFQQFPGSLGQDAQPPTSQGILAAEGLADGRVDVLVRLHAGGSWLQRFGGDLSPLARVALRDEDGWLDLAVLPGDQGVLASKDGRLARYGADLRPRVAKTSGIGALGALESSVDGAQLLAIDAARGVVVDIDPATLQARSDRWSVPKGQGVSGAQVKRIAITASGRVAVLLLRGSRVWVGVTGPDGFAWLRQAPIKAGECQHLAAAGEALLVNDCSGPLGVLAWDAADGRYIGHGLRLGAFELVNTSGFISGHRSLGRAYFHIPGGLRVGALP